MIAERFGIASTFLAFPQIDCPYSCEILCRGALKTKPVNECCKMLTPPGQFVKENEGAPRAGQPGSPWERKGSLFRRINGTNLRPLIQQDTLFDAGNELADRIVKAVERRVL